MGKDGGFQGGLRERPGKSGLVGCGSSWILELQKIVVLGYSTSGRCHRRENAAAAARKDGATLIWARHQPQKLGEREEEGCQTCNRLDKISLVLLPTELCLSFSSFKSQ